MRIKRRIKKLQYKNKNVFLQNEVAIKERAESIAILKCSYGCSYYKNKSFTNV